MARVPGIRRIFRPAGVLLALVTGRDVAPSLFETSPPDPAIFAAASATPLAAAALASQLPAWRATRVAPRIALQAG